jgi:hypothetical protein
MITCAFAMARCKAIAVHATTIGARQPTIATLVVVIIQIAFSAPLVWAQAGHDASWPGISSISDELLARNTANPVGQHVAPEVGLKSDAG